MRIQSVKQRIANSQSNTDFNFSFLQGEKTEKDKYYHFYLRSAQKAI